MEKSIVTSRGRVVIPSKLRNKFKIKTGTMVYFYEKEGKMILVPVTQKTIRNNIGILGIKGKLLKALMEEKEQERKL